MLITLMDESKPSPVTSLNAVSFLRRIVFILVLRLLTAVAWSGPSFIGLLLIKALF